MHIGLRTEMILSSTLIALTLAACGSSGSGSTPATAKAASATQTSSTPASASTSSTSSSETSSTTTASSTSSAEKSPTLEIPMKSSVGLNPIPARYTCDGADTSLPVSWSHISPNTKELVLFVFNFLPVHGKLFAGWAIAGLKPSLHGLSAGKLPAGAIVGRNSYGQARYNVCPPKGPSTQFAFLLYTLPRRIHVKPGFNANALRERTVHMAEFAGLLSFTYKRR